MIAVFSELSEKNTSRLPNQVGLKGVVFTVTGGLFLYNHVAVLYYCANDSTSLEVPQD